jgi:probable HAF family extracellular repeat protein
MMPWLTVVGTAAVALAQPSPSQPPSSKRTPELRLVDLGVLPEHVASYAMAVSQDGSTVVGYSETADHKRHAFRWTSKDGMRRIDVPNGGPAAAYGVNTDGSVVVGWGAEWSAFKWTASEGASLLKCPDPGGLARACAVSGDGLVVVGYRSATCLWDIPGRGPSHVNAEPAFRWTRADGMADLGHLDSGCDIHAYSVNADGTVIVGWGGENAFRWTRGAGLQNLGTLLDQSSSAATSVSVDGTVVVGVSGRRSGGHAFRWTGAGGMKDLGQLPGANSSSAFAVSGDGRVVVGWSGDGQRVVSEAPGRITGPRDRGFVWTDKLGMIDVNSLARRLGVDLRAWTLTYTTGANMDGSVIAGYGSTGGQERAWVLMGTPLGALSSPPPDPVPDPNPEAEKVARPLLPSSTAFAPHVDVTYRGGELRAAYSILARLARPAGWNSDIHVAVFTPGADIKAEPTKWGVMRAGAPELSLRWDGDALLATPSRSDSPDLMVWTKRAPGIVLRRELCERTLILLLAEDREPQRASISLRGAVGDNEFTEATIRLIKAPASADRDRLLRLMRSIDEKK